MLFEISEEMRRLSDLADQCSRNLESGFNFKSLLNFDKFHHPGGNYTNSSGPGNLLKMQMKAIYSELEQR